MKMENNNTESGAMREATKEEKESAKAEFEKLGVVETEKTVKAAKKTDKKPIDKNLGVKPGENTKRIELEIGKLIKDGKLISFKSDGNGNVTVQTSTGPLQAYKLATKTIAVIGRS